VAIVPFQIITRSLIQGLRRPIGLIPAPKYLCTWSFFKGAQIAAWIKISQLGQTPGFQSLSIATELLRPNFSAGANNSDPIPKEHRAAWPHCFGQHEFLLPAGFQMIALWHHIFSMQLPPVEN